MTATRLRLHFNENTAGCSPAVLDALRTLTPQDVATYPDYDAITARVARWFGVDARTILLTNGLDEGLYAVAQDGARDAMPEFIQTDPAFEMFEEFARIVGAELVRIDPETDFAFPLRRLLGAITSATRVIYLVDPNNPTGLPLPDGAAEAIAAAAPQATVFVDEAYADFSGRTLIGPALDRFPNLVIGRTFAKGHGLAGLRVGALVAHPATIARLRRVMPPFNVNIAAVRALAAALDDDGYLRWYVAQAAESRRAIAAFCDAHGLTHWPSAGNFVLVRVGSRAADITHALAARGIDVRDKSAAPGCAGCLRLTAGVVDHTDRLLTALEDILAPRTN
ncbi:MAG: histidinol-phosphate aminotransferase family protein [Acidobacteria bacterium]|nr:histidinol-phosphate aminotransferase family protein [Acidobacteriota bacterium]